MSSSIECTIKVPKYFDGKGNHVCTSDLYGPDVCPFLRHKKYQTVCVMAPDDVNSNIIIRQPEKFKLGSFIPGSWCPLKEINE